MSAQSITNLLPGVAANIDAASRLRLDPAALRLVADPQHRRIPTAVENMDNVASHEETLDPAELTFTTLRPEHFAGLAALQRACYPTLSPDELMREEHFASQHAVFAAGQIVVLCNGQVIGQGSGFFTDFDFAAPAHRFRDFCDGFYFRTHSPEGAYYYGADISVHPGFRGRGIGRAIYQARKALVLAHKKRGIVAGGLLPGYPAHRSRLSIAAYVAAVVDGQLHDPTLSFQLGQGFVVRGLLPDYIDDSASDGVATLLVWEAGADADLAAGPTGQGG